MSLSIKDNFNLPSSPWQFLRNMLLMGGEGLRRKNFLNSPVEETTGSVTGLLKIFRSGPYPSVGQCSLKTNSELTSILPGFTLKKTVLRSPFRRTTHAKAFAHLYKNQNISCATPCYIFSGTPLNAVHNRACSPFACNQGAVLC